jgi:hypothetical protein
VKLNENCDYETIFSKKNLPILMHSEKSHLPRVAIGEWVGQRYFRLCLTGGAQLAL